LNADKINKWLVLGANVGVLIGIILVVLEIRQATITTNAEMVSNHQNRWVEISLSMQNAEFAEAWAKAMQDHDELSVSEMIQVSGFLWAFIDQLHSNQRLWQLGVFVEAMPSTEQVIQGNASFFFGSEFAQSWWAENKANINPQLATILDQEIENTARSENLETYERIRERMHK
jgi:hypothetical protein